MLKFRFFNFLPMVRAAVVAFLMSLIPLSSTAQDEAYLSLRDMVFDLETNEEFHAFVDADLPLAVIMETDIEGQTMTLVMVAEGTTSIYFSDGGGMIGGGEYDFVRAEVFQLLGMVDQFANHFSEADTRSRPSTGMAHFYVVRRTGVFRSEEFVEEDMWESGNLSALFRQAHAVIGGLREVQMAQQ